jgi:hypothetical protein
MINGDRDTRNTEKGVGKRRGIVGKDESAITRVSENERLDTIVFDETINRGTASGGVRDRTPTKR